jgi:hypothetical protein
MVSTTTASSGGLENHGVALVDFRAMSVDEKKAWVILRFFF